MKQERTRGVRCSAWLGDWVAPSMGMIWYRFGKRLTHGTRMEWELPLWCGWLFDTKPWLFDGFIFPPEQARNPSIVLWVRRFVFYRRYLDPVVLPVAGVLLRLVNLVRPPLSTAGQDQSTQVSLETTTDSERLLGAVRSRLSGHVEWLNRAELCKWSYRAIVPARTLGAECSESYICSESPNDPSSPTGARNRDDNEKQ